MKYLWILILAVAVFAIEPGDIAINEVCFDPDGPDEEWIELRNNLDIEVTLDSSVTISDGEGTYHFEGIMIPEGGLITLMSRTDGSFPFDATLDITAAAIQLANGSDEVILRQGETVIDSFKYHSSWTEETYTLERINPVFFAIHPDNWSNGTDPAGTPGAENSIFNMDTNFPPAILLTSHEPNMPTSTDLVTISAMIIDEDSHLAVNLRYTTGTDTMSVTMDETDAYHYSADTDRYSHGTMVSYFVIAEDGTAQVDTSAWRSYFVIDSTVEGFIVINEIMYDSPGSDTEWVELYNRSTEDIDLAGWTIKDGSSSIFTFDDGESIAGNGFLVIAKSTEEFIAHYGELDVLTGNFPFSLNNSGDSLILRDNTGRMIDQVAYSTSVDWPIEPHGDGYSLSLIDPELDNKLGVSWLASDELWGTPGAVNFPDAIAEKGTKPETMIIGTIAPNPFNGAVSIDIAEGAQVRIFDVQGKMVHEMTSYDRAWIPDTDIPTGVYLLRATLGNEEASRKLVYMK